MALGERREWIVGRVVGRTGMMVGSGVVVGTIGALAARGIGGDALRLTSAADPVTYIAVTSLVLGTALVSAWIPAHRLSRVDPAETLRRDT